MTEPASRAVFLSYASQDTPAVAAVASALRADGIEVWFDQDELRGGEAWDAKIKKQIRECALFAPVISANTQARPEGYFRLEWHLAEQRSLLIARGRPFIVPVCLDATKEGDALVPEAFLAVQWTRLPLRQAQGLQPGEKMMPAFVAQVKRLLAGGATPVGSGSAAVRSGSVSPAGKSGTHPDAPAIPDYELLRQIGRGAYGDVWIARGLTGTYRAIKIVWRDRFDDAAPFEREFRGVKEAMAISLEAGQLPLLHIGQDEAAGYFYYVMELADDASGRATIDPERYVPLTLKELKARKGRLPAAQCLQFAEDLAQALAALHTRGLVHRDIKPSNVVIVRGRPTLADIGLLASVGDAKTYVGTQGYLAPEGPGSAVADVFALGRLLYELATGFDREEFPRLPADITDRAERTALFELNEILLRAGEPLAQNRYRDASAMLADLRARRSRGASRRRSRGLGLAAAGVAVAAAAGFFWWRSATPAAVVPLPPSPPAPGATATKTPPEKSIAVLPFANMSDDRENGYFADGVSEDILTNLANLSSLRVIARTTMQQYRQTTKPIRQIASELTVAYVLEGSVRRAGTKVRVTGQLIRAATEEPVWSKTYDRDLTDVFAIQSELSHDIVAALQVVLTTQDESRLAARPTSNIAAYDLYQQARALEDSSSDPKEVGQKQLPLLEQAVQLDPNYAEAWALLSDVRLDASSQPFQQPDPAVVAQSRADLDRAARLAPDNYNVLMRQSGSAAYQGDRAAVNRYRQRIVELYPNRAEAWYAIGLTAGYEHRYQDQVAAYRKALTIDPRNGAILYSLGDCLEDLRRYDEYAEVLRQRRILQPGVRHLEFEQALIPLHQRGSTTELRAWLASLPAQPDPTDTDLVSLRAQAYFALGDAAAFVRLWREAGPHWRFHEVRVLDEITVAMALQALHDPTDIRPLLEKACDRARAVLQREPKNLRRMNQLGAALTMMGEKAEARATLARVRELARESDAQGPGNGNRDAWFYNGVWRAWGGEVAEAIPQMTGAFQGTVATPHAFVHEMRLSIFMLPFRGNPAFEALLDDPANNAPIFANGDPVPPPVAAASLVAEKSIAVLPFTNLSDDKENGYLADGIQEDVVTALANVRELKVVSSTSAMRYRGTTKSMQQIGAELGVAFIVTGSLRREANQVRVTAQLIDARTDQQVWARKFDRELKEVLALQSALADEIVPALQLVLSPEEKALLARAPTSNESAYDLFLRARTLRDLSACYSEKASAGQGLALLQQAVAEDPRFVRAWVELANLYTDQYFYSPESRTAAQIALAEGAMAKARELAPDAPEVLLGQGRIKYYCYRDYPGAMYFYQQILDRYPNYPDVRLSLGLLYRRLGRWPESVTELRRAYRQEPGSRASLTAFLSTLVLVRRFEEVEGVVREALALMPNNQNLKFSSTMLAFRLHGSRREFEQWLAELPAGLHDSPDVIDQRLEWAMMGGGEAVIADLLGRSPMTEDRIDTLIVLIHAGQRAKALELLEQIKPAIDRNLAADPLAGNEWTTLAKYHALRGERKETLEAVNRARQLQPESTDAINGMGVAVACTEALAWLGEKDTAIAEVQRLLNKPAGVSGWQLQHSLEWLPLRGDPRIEAIINDPANSAPLF